MKRTLHLVTLLIVVAGAACSAPTPDESLEETPLATQAPTPTRQPENRGVPITPTPSPLTESSIQRIRETGTVRVGVLYNYPPFSYVDETGALQGYEYELMQTIAATWEVEVAFIQVTRQTRLEMLLAGEIDVLAATTPQDRDMDAFVDFTDPIFLGGYALLVSENDPEANIASFSGRDIGVVDPLAHQALDGFDAQPMDFDNYDVAVAALQSGSIGAIMDRREVLMRIASSAQGVTLSNNLVVPEAYAFAVREGDTPLRDLLDLTLQQLNDEGTFSQIFSAQFYRYTADSYRTYLGENSLSINDFPDAVGSDSTIERIRSGLPVRVAGLALNEEPIPFDGQTIVDGYNRAIVNEMARRWNVPVEELPDSIAEQGLALLSDGQADIVVGVTPQRETIGQVSYSAAYYQRGVRVAHLDDVTVTGIADLDFRDALALPPTTITTDLIEDNNGFPAYQETDQLEEAYEALLERGPTALVADELTIILMGQSSEDIEIVGERYRPVDQVIAMRADDNELQALINYTIQDLEAEGILATLAEQYFGNYVLDGEALPLPEQGILQWPGDGSYLRIGQYQ